jgi:hypothetical protein
MSSQKNKIKTIRFLDFIGDNTLSHVFHRAFVLKNNSIPNTLANQNIFDRSFLFLHQLLRHRFKHDFVGININEDNVDCEDSFKIQLHNLDEDEIQIIHKNTFRIHEKVFHDILKLKNCLNEFFILNESIIHNMDIEKNEDDSLTIQVVYGNIEDEEYIDEESENDDDI